MIDLWSAIGASSVEGLRDDWFDRPGVLTEDAEGLHLAVERRAHDVLLRRAPFEFSVIHHAWMPKPLSVTWRF